MDKELNPVSDLCQFSAAITTHRIRLLLHFSASKMILLYYRATKTFICTASLQSIFVISTIFKKETSKGGKPQFIQGKVLIPCPLSFWFLQFFCGREKERRCKSSGSQHLLPDLGCPQRKLMHTGDTSRRMQIFCDDSKGLLLLFSLR